MLGNTDHEILNKLINSFKVLRKIKKKSCSKIIQTTITGVFFFSGILFLLVYIDASHTPAFSFGLVENESESLDQ